MVLDLDFGNILVRFDVADTLSDVSTLGTIQQSNFVESSQAGSDFALIWLCIVSWIFCWFFLALNLVDSVNVGCDVWENISCEEAN